MNLYEYIALSANGEKVSGSIFAESYNDAYKYICAKKKNPLKITPVNQFASKEISVEDLLMFFLHIDLQLKCKVRISDAIESFLDVHGNKILRSSLRAILIDLKNGISLGEAFEKCDKIFDPVIIGLLKSAEQTGKLSDIISNILKFLKLKSEWKNNIKRAIAYPIFIACTALLVLFFSITLLGPQIIELIKNFGPNEEVPLLTQLIIEHLPHILKSVLYVSLLTAVIFATSIVFSSRAKSFFIDCFLRIPKIGELIIKTNFWQICKIIQIALDAKLDFIGALDIAIESIKIENIRNELRNAQNKIVNGHSISEAFIKTKFISERVMSAIDIGEEGANLAASFGHMSDNQYEEITLDIKALGQNLSVGLTVFAGLIFILIVCGLLFPIYSYIEVTGV